MIKALMRRAAERAGFTIVRTSHLPYGLDMTMDVKKLCHQWDYVVDTIFDVGANVGQSTSHYRASFPEARIIAFEPTPAAFEKLSENIGISKRVTAERIALGAEVGDTELYVYDLSVLNSLTPITANSTRYNTEAKKIPCRVETVDSYCSRNTITNIDLLKIDTEGTELNVLHGAEEILTAGGVRFVYAEFNEILPISNVVGGALAPLASFLSLFGFKFVATYTDWIEPRGGHFVVSNALFVRR